MPMPTLILSLSYSSTLSLSIALSHSLSFATLIDDSVLGHRIPEVPVPLFSVYPATKHAITALCQTVRQEIHFLKLNIKLTVS